ncbi:hypothetical protein RQM47_13830 [Rubrivirga sp. S365]|uniref:Uncharacterized protein n=1 Tax=Rubrivirga litoralis TaxID=3075598 RepID=A0ABU3BMT9_9BACT|nr:MULTISPECIES: hypothetical protein [unclassified Rubrivirga]MDT0630561.1 hypothetical protein [Rubrivirga sp. F394]MDT7857727.1 hypothetical protein [Rubrivirga sp. S365]
MQFILDHMIASVVAAILTVAMMAQQINNRQASIERISVYSAKAQALAFGEWLEDDVVKLGSRFGQERGRFSMKTRPEGGVKFTEAFTFHYNSEVQSDGAVRRVEISYRLVPDTETRAVVEKGDTPADDVRIPVYRLRRDSLSGLYNPESKTWLAGSRPAPVPTPSYQAPVGLRHFQVQPLDSQGREFDDLTPGHADDYAHKADYARLQFTVVPTLFPLHRARLVPKEGLHWATTIELRPF